MNPKIWGGYAWFFLHSVTLNYPDDPSSEDKQRMKDFFNSLKYVLPCNSCSKHLRSHIRNRPLTDRELSSRKKLIYWLIDIHNDVNKDTGKRAESYDSVMKSIESKYQ